MDLVGRQVIDSGGYLKVVDYGTAKVLPLSSRTRTLLGCAEYLAPEMIFCKQYNRSVDFWQLGILMFELLTRTTPFAHTNMVRWRRQRGRRVGMRR